VHGIDQVRVGPLCQSSKRRADTFKAITKAFAAVTGNQDNLLVLG